MDEGEREQIRACRRAARALLGLSQDALAAESGVGRMTLKRWEDAEPIRPAQEKVIQDTLKNRGVVFVTDIEFEDGEQIEFGVGIRPFGGKA